MKKLIELTGLRFGRLVVLAYSHRHTSPSGGGKAMWHCRCDCGNAVVASGSNLRGGNTTSCGCFRVEVTTANNTTHGQSKSGEYHSWFAMKQRCTNSKSAMYHLYGGRGISVCERWTDSFEDFLQDMGPKPTPNHSIERRENSGNYEPDNCHWATTKQQNNNQRSNVRITHGGKTLNIAQWSSLLGIPRPTLYNRVRRGWSLDQVLTGRNPVVHTDPS